MSTVKIYYEFKETADEVAIYTFKTYICEFLIVSQIVVSKYNKEKVKGGNKRKSKELSIAHIFMESSHCNLTENPYKKPELNLWNSYLSSLWISKRTFLRWIDKRITETTNKYVVKLLREAKK